MTGLKPEFLPELFRAATTGAAEIALLLQKGDDPRLADYLHPDSSREMEVAILPFQSFLSEKGIPHTNSPELTAASNLFFAQWKALADAAGQFLPTDDRLTLSAAVKSAADALVNALADKVDAKKNRRLFNNLVSCLCRSAASAAKGIETKITKQNIQTDSFAEVRQFLASLKSNGKYPPIMKGHYANSIIGDCDRNSGIIEIVNVGFFHISPRNNGMWNTIRKLVETTDERGYVHLGDRIWRNAFTSMRSAKVPTELAAKGVMPSADFVKYIKPRAKDGFYRLELPD